MIFDGHDQGKYYDLYSSVFSSCVNLVELQLNYGLRMINDYCFAYCNNLENINLPSSVSTIGIYAFTDTKIKSMKFDKNCTIQNFGSFAFAGATYLETINIPATVQSLGDNLFQSTKISQFIVPNLVENISNYCFKDCSLLKTFIIPDNCSLQSIGFGCFQGCRNLFSFVCQDKRYFEVDNGALFNSGRSNLICFPPASSIKHFCFSQNVNRIAVCAFLDCIKIESIAIPDNSVVSIGAQAFAYCINLKSINIPLSVTTVDANAFLGCKNLNCGVLIDSKNKDFIKNLITTGGLSYSATKACGIITCFQRVTDVSRIGYSSIAVFIMM